MTRRASPKTSPRTACGSASQTTLARHFVIVGLGVFSRLKRRARAVEAASGDREDDALGPSQTFDLTIGAIVEGPAGHEDAIGPGLELVGNGEVVERHADHHGIGGEELVQSGLAVDDIGLQGRLMGPIDSYWDAVRN